MASDDQATAPAGAVTVGAVPHALNVVVLVTEAPLTVKLDEYSRGTFDVGATSSCAVAAGLPFEAGIEPRIRVAAVPPVVVTCVVDAGTNRTSET